MTSSNVPSRLWQMATLLFSVHNIPSTFVNGLVYLFSSHCVSHPWHHQAVLKEISGNLSISHKTKLRSSTQNNKCVTQAHGAISYETGSEPSWSHHLYEIRVKAHTLHTHVRSFEHILLDVHGIVLYIFSGSNHRHLIGRIVRRRNTQRKFETTNVTEDHTSQTTTCLQRCYEYVIWKRTRGEKSPKIHFNLGVFTENS